MTSENTSPTQALTVRIPTPDAHNDMLYTARMIEKNGDMPLGRGANRWYDRELTGRPWKIVSDIVYSRITNNFGEEQDIARFLFCLLDLQTGKYGGVLEAQVGGRYTLNSLRALTWSEATSGVMTLRRYQGYPMHPTHGYPRDLFLFNPKIDTPEMLFDEDAPTGLGNGRAASQPVWDQGRADAIRGRITGQPAGIVDAMEAEADVARQVANAQRQSRQLGYPEHPPVPITPSGKYPEPQWEDDPDPMPRRKRGRPEGSKTQR